MAGEVIHDFPLVTLEELRRCSQGMMTPFHVCKTLQQILKRVEIADCTAFF